jgi:hypothetical protein
VITLGPGAFRGGEDWEMGSRPHDSIFYEQIKSDRTSALHSSTVLTPGHSSNLGDVTCSHMSHVDWAEFSFFSFSCLLLLSSDFCTYTNVFCTQWLAAHGCVRMKEKMK